MGTKLNLDELSVQKEPKNILKEKAGLQGKDRKAASDKLSAYVKFYLKPHEKKQLERVAGRNISAYMRDLLIEHGIIY